jgi:hypothetical protein
MKTKEEIEQLAEQYYISDYNTEEEQSAAESGYIDGYLQCQEDMADVIKDIYLNAYEDGQNNRFLAKENFINSLNKQD